MANQGRTCPRMKPSRGSPVQRKNPGTSIWAPGSSQTRSPGCLSPVCQYTSFLLRMLREAMGHLHLKVPGVRTAEGARDPCGRPGDSRRIPGPEKAEHSLQQGRGSLPVLVWPWSQVLQQKTLWRRKKPHETPLHSAPLHSFPPIPSLFLPPKGGDDPPSLFQLPPAL